MREKCTAKIKWLTALLLFSCTMAWAQDRVVTGKITSAEDKSAIPGASVVQKGSSNGTASDSDGMFKINVPANATLVFSFIGYKSQEVEVGTQSTVDVVLETDVTALAEVVVIGYGQQERKDVTGSVAPVSSKDFNRGVLASPQDLLIGKVAGVQITTQSGAPGSSATIRIRGANTISGSSDPLIVIDGFPVDNSPGTNGAPGNVPGLANPLSLLNPNDIETFTVLKDASATAIYGLRGANGVIIITTKKGKEGKPEISYNGNYSVSNAMKYFDVLTGDQLRATAQTEFAAGLSGLDAAGLTHLGTSNTNWQKEVYRSAVSHDHNLSVSGTYKSLPYRISYGFTDQEGILKTTNFVRNSININLNPTYLDGDLQVTASFKGNNTKQNFGNTGAVGAAIAFDPTQPVYNGNTTWGGYYTWTTDFAGGTMNPNGPANSIAPANPVALLNQTDNRSNVFRGIGSLKVDYRLRFFPALKITVNGGFDYSTSTGYNNNPNNAAFTFAGGGGSLTNYTGINRSKLLDIYGNYSKTIGKNKFDVTGGYSYQSFQIYSTNFVRNGAVNPIYSVSQNKLDASGNPVLGTDGKAVQEPYQTVPQLNYLLSFFGRVNYSYNDKYLFTASMRDDASSRFAKQNQWAIFPSAALGWKIKQENFLSDVTFLSDLKLRGSYGITGNQNINLNSSSQNQSYPYLGLYQQGQPAYQYQFGSGFVNTQRPAAYDANLKWEKTAQTDIGVDFGFLQNRITGAIDVYQKNTSGLLNQVQIPLGSNFSNSIITNVGNLTNKGIELSLRAQVIKTDNFEWIFGYNISHNENKITKLLSRPDSTSQGNNVGGISGGLGGTIQNNQVGYPINSFFVYQQVYNQQGKPVEGVYIDQTGKGGVVTANTFNKIRFHSPQAKVLMGINSRVTYKKFDFAFQGRLSLGNYVYNNNVSARAYYTNLYYQSGYFNNLPSAVKETNFKNPQSYSSYYIQNASFFKMDNMSVGYNIDGLLAQKLKGRVGFTVQNAFFITKYKGVDPEVDGGIDNTIYPRARVFMLSLNLTY